MCRENLIGNLCPQCGKEVPPAEWASYMKCEDCWAGNPYLPKSNGQKLITGAKDTRSSRRERQ